MAVPSERFAIRRTDHPGIGSLVASLGWLLQVDIGPLGLVSP